MRARALSLALSSMVIVGAVACGGDGDSAATFQDVYDLGIDQYLGTVEPTAKRTEGDFVAYDFAPADGPQCFDGSTFSPDFHDTGSDNLVIFFPGGGACWSDLCAATYFTIPGSFAERASQLFGLEVGGEPLSSWNLASLSYCDGSLFSGDADYDDDGDGAIDRFQQHVGGPRHGEARVPEPAPDPDRGRERRRLLHDHRALPGAAGVAGRGDRRHQRRRGRPRQAG